MSRIKKTLPMAISVNLVVTGLALPSIAMAQEGQAEQAVIEEVVVTARKRAENLQQVPMAVTAFTEKTIDQAGIERVQDFIALTPNVSIVDSANTGDTQVTIRGLVSTRDAESTFAYVVDGVLITNPNGFNEELFDVQQIEVLKGPQGALYGRNATAGAILVTTKKPSNEFESQIKIGGGSDGLVKGSAVVSGPIVKDSMFARVAVSARETDGEYDNIFTGNEGEVDYFEDTSLRGRLLWEANDKLSVDTQFGVTETKGGAINFNATFNLPGAAAGFNNPALNEDVNDHAFAFMFNVPGENEQEAASFSVKADYELDKATLTTIVAYDDLEEYLLSDGTSAAFGGYSFGNTRSQTACTSTFNDGDLATLINGAPPFYAVPNGNPPADQFYAPDSLFDGFPGGLNALLPPYSPTTCDGYQYQERNQESLSLEVKLSSDAEASLRWLGGFYFAEIEREVVVAYGADLGQGFLRQAYVPAGGVNPTDLLFSDQFDTTVISAFGQIEFDLPDQQEIAFAVRWDHEDREVTNQVPNVSAAEAYGAFGATASINPAFGGNATIPDREKSFVQVQPKISWRRIIDENVTIYSSYGVGFRSGGFNSIGSSDTISQAFGSFATFPVAVNDNYEKEVSKSLELGAKTQWLNNRLRVNVAAFNTKVEDNQFFNFFAGSFGLLRVVTNIDEVNLKGAELDFVAVIDDNWTMHGGVGVVESRIVENKNRPYTEDNDAPLAPESTANFGVQYLRPIMSGIDFIMRVDYQYVGDTWFHTVQDGTDTVNAFTDLSATYGVDGFGFGTSNFAEAQRDAYGTTNMRLSVEAAQWALTAWGTNITDEDYLEEVIPAPEFGGSFIHPGKGAIYGVDATYSF